MSQIYCDLSNSTFNTISSLRPGNTRKLVSLARFSIIEFGLLCHFIIIFRGTCDYTNPTPFFCPFMQLILLNYYNYYLISPLDKIKQTIESFLPYELLPFVLQIVTDINMINLLTNALRLILLKDLLCILKDPT